MRTPYFVLCLAGCGMLAGCLSHRKPPYADDPTLLHYKPTLSDSATILAERQTRRGLTRPPMPVVAREETRESVLPASVPTFDTLQPVKSEVQTGPLGPPPSESSPRSFPSTLPQRPADGNETPTTAGSPSAAISPGALLPPPDATPAAAAKPAVPLAEAKPAVPASVPGTAAPPASAGVAASPRAVEGNFGHGEDYHWLQGVVEKHYRGYYCVRYCDPSVEDVYGGKFRLEDDRRLEKFEEGDVIGLKGDLLPGDESKGRFTTPTFRMHDVWLVRKK